MLPHACLAALGAALLATTLTACDNAPQQPPPAAAPSAPASPAPVTTPLWREFSGEKALAEARSQFDIGPRPAGSKELAQCRELITRSLTASGWEVEEQAFTNETPRGPVRFVNLVARCSAVPGNKPARDTQRAIVCSHYDTKRFSTIRFAGANDGASSSGALVELARVLALRPSLAARVELVFFDGEEAFVQFTETDGLYGSRHYARSLREASRAGQFTYAILWDMIGDKDLTITLSPDSPQPLTAEVLASAKELKLHSYFSYFERPILDDHVPLNQARIPSIDLIDFDYLPWHTADDTFDKLSPESLRKVGAITLHHLERTISK